MRSSLSRSRCGTCIQTVYFPLSKVRHDLKGAMSSQAHARVDEKHFKIVGPTFSNTVREIRNLFSSV